ncbi:hypothetical protein [Saccharothrix hoggarensis]|uniref:Uncharacterized protein n=1 Tax=Saccharothrix hoggarensis TaxID=913853 RepID=A0ABW3QI97_9PSEU
MDDFESLEPLDLPGRRAILAQALALPRLAEDLGAHALVRLFGGFRNASAAMSRGADLAFYLAWERGASLPDLARPIGKGYKKSAASRRNILTRPVTGYPEGSHQLVDHIRRQYAAVGGDLGELDAFLDAVAPVPFAEERSRAES